MDQYISIDWPYVDISLRKAFSMEETNEMFTIMKLIFQLADDKKEKFIARFRFPRDGEDMGITCGFRFIAWLISNRGNLEKYLERSEVYIAPEWKKWIDFLLQNYTPVRPMEVFEEA